MITKSKTSIYEQGASKKTCRGSPAAVWIGWAVKATLMISIISSTTGCTFYKYNDWVTFFDNIHYFFNILFILLICSYWIRSPLRDNEIWLYFLGVIILLYLCKNTGDMEDRYEVERILIKYHLIKIHESPQEEIQKLLREEDIERELDK